jgi:hypothetical protein
MKQGVTVFWDTASCGVKEVYRVSVVFAATITLTMETASTSEKLVNFHHTARRSIQEDSHLDNCLSEDLKCYQV